MTNLQFFSLRLPFGIYVHYAKGRKIGESKPAYDKGLVHYNRRGKLIGKMVRSFFGEPNHYDIYGQCTGYSRKSSFVRIVHFDCHGNEVGCTYTFMGILLFTVFKYKTPLH